MNEIQRPVLSPMGFVPVAGIPFTSYRRWFNSREEAEQILKMRMIMGSCVGEQAAILDYLRVEIWREMASLTGGTRLPEENFNTNLDLLESCLRDLRRHCYLYAFIDPKTACQSIDLEIGLMDKLAKDLSSSDRIVCDEVATELESIKVMMNKGIEDFIPDLNNDLRKTYVDYDMDLERRFGRLAYFKKKHLASFMNQARDKYVGDDDYVELSKDMVFGSGSVEGYVGAHSSYMHLSLFMYVIGLMGVPDPGREGFDSLSTMMDRTENNPRLVLKTLVDVKEYLAGMQRGSSSAGDPVKQIARMGSR